MSHSRILLIGTVLSILSLPAITACNRSAEKSLPIVEAQAAFEQTGDSIEARITTLIDPDQPWNADGKTWTVAGLILYGLESDKPPAGLAGGAVIGSRFFSEGDRDLSASGVMTYPLDSAERQWLLALVMLQNREEFIPRLFQCPLTSLAAGGVNSLPRNDTYPDRFTPVDTGGLAPGAWADVTLSSGSTGVTVALKRPEMMLGDKILLWHATVRQKWVATVPPACGESQDFLSSTLLWLATKTPPMMFGNHTDGQDGEKLWLFLQLELYDLSAKTKLPLNVYYMRAVKALSFEDEFLEKTQEIMFEACP